MELRFLGHACFELADGDTGTSTTGARSEGVVLRLGETYST